MLAKEARLVRLSVATVVIAALADDVSLGLQLSGVHPGLGRSLLRLDTASWLVTNFAQETIWKDGLTWPFIMIPTNYTQEKLSLTIKGRLACVSCQLHSNCRVCLQDHPYHTTDCRCQLDTNCSPDFSFANRRHSPGEKTRSGSSWHYSLDSLCFSCSCFGYLRDLASASWLDSRVFHSRPSDSHRNVFTRYWWLKHQSQ